MPEPDWSESVYLDGVAPDGRTGFVVRLGRHPAQRTAWVWAHVFTADGAVSFNDERVPCDPDMADVEGSDTCYAAGNLAVQFCRSGPRLGLLAGTAVLDVAAHRGATAPYGPGDVPLHISASFRPIVTSGAGTLPGRTEVHGVVSLSATWPDGGLELEAFGQWHEQHQIEPRFRVPFTYMTLRGEHAGLTGVIGAAGSGGIVRRGGVIERAAAVSISPPSAIRDLTIQLEDGSTLDGRLDTVHRYVVPLAGQSRPGTLVAGTIAGSPVSGCVNDFVPS